MSTRYFKSSKTGQILPFEKGAMSVEQWKEKVNLQFGELEEVTKDEFAAWVTEINTPTPAQQYAIDVANWKAERQVLVDNIKVTWQKDAETAVVFQGDELSQTRMSRAITALTDDTTEVNWTADDNSVHAVTRPVLVQLLFDAGQQQTEIWNEGRPTKPEGVE